MYRFHDTTELTMPWEDLPSEALCLNGVYLEQMIPGYQTLYTVGRENNAREVSSSESTERDGARFRSVRRTKREIQVAFQIKSRGAREYAQKFNDLKNLVRTEESQLIFNDETDKYYTGTLTDIEVDNPGELCVEGRLIFECSDPYKYAVQERTVRVNATNGRAAFELEYQGTVEAYPTIETTTRSNTETLLFSDDAGNMITIGTPDLTASNLTRGSRIMAATASSLKNQSPRIIDRAVGENTIMMPVRQPDEQQVIVSVDGTDFLTIPKVDVGNYAWPEEEDSEEEEGSSEIDTSSITGLTCLKAISSTSGVNYICRVQPLFYADDFRETGYLHFGLMFDVTHEVLYDRDMHEVEEAEIILEKTGIGSPYANALLCLYGNVVKRVRIRVDKDNPVTGLGGYGLGISRFGTVYTFILGEEQYEVDAAAYQNSNAGNMPKYAVFSVARIIGQQQMAGMGFASAKITATTYSTADQVVEIMRSTDRVSVNCATGDIRISGRPNPDLGSIENKWTEFSLKPGFNKIECSATTSEAGGKKPTYYTITYREAWE